MPGYLEEAFKHHSEGRLDIAIRMYTELLKHSENDGTLRYLLGTALAQMHEYDRAIHHLKSAVLFQPKNAAAHNALGISYQSLSLFDDAESSFRKALACDSNFFEAQQNLAIALQQQNKTQEAKTVFENCIVRFPKDLALRLNFGILLFQSGDFDSAVSQFLLVTGSEPGNAAAWYNLACTFQAMTLTAKAADCYFRVLEIQPDHTDSLVNLGVIAFTEKRFDDALRFYSSAIERGARTASLFVDLGTIYSEKNDFFTAADFFSTAVQEGDTSVDTYIRLGLAYKNTGRLESAVQTFQSAVKLDPTSYLAHYRLADVLSACSLFEDAVPAAKTAISLKPDFDDAYLLLGYIFLMLHREHDAEEMFRAAVIIDPANYKTYNNLGVIFLQFHGDVIRAEEYYRKGLSLSPDSPELQNNFGVLQQSLMRLDDAEICFNKACELNIQYGDAHKNRAMLFLLTGRFREGWDEYEWRLWDKPPAVTVNAPYYQPGMQRVKRMLVRSEQGLGDAIQFSRFLPLLRAFADEVIFECPNELLSLAHHSAQGFTVCSEAQAAGHDSYSAYVPLLSVTRLLSVTLKNLPAEVPYLFPLAKDTNRFKKLLYNDGNSKIGIVWAGNPRHKRDIFRSCSFGEFAFLCALPNISVYNLQKGTAPIFNGEAFSHPSWYDLTAELSSLADTAALIQQLDLVISVDTSVAHLAGALGKEVWLLVPFSPDWRWLLQRGDSPWYPSMKLFRQPALGDWKSVFQNVSQSLGKRFR